MLPTMLSFAAPTSPEGYYFVGTFVSFTVVYVVLLAFYRLFCSPISHIPGPLLARLTFSTSSTMTGSVVVNIICRWRKCIRNMVSL